MRTMTLGTTEVEVNDEGFFVHPEQWTEDMAPELAAHEGIDELTDAALAGHRLHAQGVLREGHRPDRPRARQDVGCLGEGAVPAVPEGAGEDRRQDRRHPQAPRLHLREEISTHGREPTIEKVSIVVSKGSLEGIYPGLIMANGARAEGIEANLFFTFFGLDAIHKDRHDTSRSRPSATPACTSRRGSARYRACRH